MMMLVSLVCGVAAFRVPSHRPRRVLSATPVIEETLSSSVKVRIPVAGAVTKAAFKRAAAELATKREIPGWSKKDAPKIPASIVAGAVGHNIVKAKAIEHLAESEVHSAISQLGIAAVGQAQHTQTVEDMITHFTPGEDFDLVVSVDVWPETEWSTPWDEPLTVTVEKVKKDDDVRDKAMDALRERYAELADSADPAKMGDVIIVDMEGFERTDDGQKGGALPVVGAVGGDDLEIHLDKGKFMPEFIEALVGASVGETKMVMVDFPEQKQYRDNMPLAGRKAVFEVNVKAVRTRTIPELSDDFAGKIRPGLTLEELKASVEYTVGSQEESKTNDKVHDALEAALIQRTTTVLPDSVVTESARQKFAIMLADMRSQGLPDEQLKEMITKEGFEKYKNVVRPNVEAELRARLAVESIAKSEGIQADDEDIEDQLELARRQYAQQEDKEQSGVTFNDDRAREKIAYELVRIKVLDKLAETAAITYVDPPAVDDAAAPQFAS